jgi:hypothetical protein
MIPLLAETGDFFILHELCRMFGGVFVPLGEPVEMVRELLKAMERK